MHEMKASIANIANLYRLGGIIPSTKPQTYDSIFPPGLCRTLFSKNHGDGGKLHTPPGRWRDDCGFSSTCVCMYVCVFTPDCICMCPPLQNGPLF